MKKFLTILVSGIILGLSLVVLAACSTPEVQGSAYASRETLKYDVLDENGDVIGELTTVLTRYTSGSEMKTAHIDDDYTAGSVEGFTFVQTATLNDGRTMTSEAVVDGFTTLAGYKKIDGTEISYKYNKKNYEYTLNGDSQKKIKAANAVDNALLYVYPRTDENLSATFSVVDPVAREIYALSVAKSTKTKTVSAEVFDLSLGETVKKTISGDEYVFARTEAPIGTPIYVYYSEESYKLYPAVNGLGAYNYSFRIPLIIIENDLTYILTSAVAE
ncbi:MAG: hypothetical protein LBN25_05085 [Christensenellaceae bacterium]|jgi:hypothetical protein|nr:hypothetical protein [Christensenellaceae bacterium]